MSSQSAHLRTLSEKLRRTEELLDGLEGLVADTEPVRRGFQGAEGGTVLSTGYGT
ncbi:hypothetical protein ABZX60_09735 [Streptomyces olivaceus]|uniref:hypothetical protein n=2 Tax=Streptomyces TaxID=1883 RepID=UPI001CCBC22E|nr:hypothetical protein [Streptomyces olivaceus]MBZ6134667.1 hypothetical protein [Streptomyces olivaceus]MBZ6252886.1 hypothetical protein [Streptomyces olivaceus]